MKTVNPLGTQAVAPHQQASSWMVLWDRPDRLVIAILAVLASLVFIFLGSELLPADGRAGRLIFDHPSVHFYYPFTIQNFEHVLLF